MKIVCPEKVTAISCSPDGNYCLVALLDKIFIWQVILLDLILIGLHLSIYLLNVALFVFDDFYAAFIESLSNCWSKLYQFFWFHGSLFCI